MKKIVLFISLTIFATTLFSQGVRMGLTASPQLSWMKSDATNVSTDGLQFGFDFGLTTDFFFAERYSFSTGLTINNTGGKLKYNDSISFKTNDKTYMLTPNAKVNYNMQYVDIPLAFRMESNQIGYFLFYAQFGVTNHIRVRATADIDDENIIDVNDNEVLSISGVGCKDEISPYSMGYNIGGGLNYYFSKNTAITIGVIYNNGFIDATKNSTINDNVSLRSVTFKIGILF